jgi:hypothetical protein
MIPCSAGFQLDNKTDMVVMQLLAYQVRQSTPGTFFHDWNHHAKGFWRKGAPDKQPAYFQTSGC